MSLDSSHDALGLLLAKMAASYNRPEPPPVMMAPKAPKVAKPKKGSGSLHCAPPKVQHDTAPPTIAIPATGSLDGEGFVSAMLATYDKVDGKKRIPTRDEKIQAIAAYIGYDFGGCYGTQESAAYAKAKREKRSVSVNPAEPFKAKSVLPTMAGFIAGMPQEEAKKIGDLLGRERIYQDNLVDLVKKQDEFKVDLSQEIRVEKARIAKIHADLAAFGKLFSPID